MTTIDTSKIDRMDLRQDILALEEKRKGLVAVFEAVNEEAEAEIDRESAIYERERRERSEAFYARCAEIPRAHGGGDKSAEDALEDHDNNSPAYGECIDFDDDGLAERCCITGLPLLDGDETVEDSEGRKALANAIPGWPSFGEEDAGVEEGLIDAIADGVRA